MPPKTGALFIAICPTPATSASFGSSTRLPDEDCRKQGADQPARRRPARGPKHRARETIGHFADVLVSTSRLRDEGNYVGPTINRTARLRDLAHGGQTVLSGTTDDVVSDSLPEGAWLNDLGAHSLRDLARPQRVVQLCHSDLPN